MLYHWLNLVALCWLGAVATAAETYKNDPNVFELTPATFDQVVHGSNYTTVVKFYAPWCGYCKQMHPGYSKLGKFVTQEGQYAAQVAAVNCDVDSNKQLCAHYRIQGFPSILVFRPPKYDGNSVSSSRHTSETYQGERSFKAILNMITSRLKNYVKKFKLGGEALPKWLAEVPSADEEGKVLIISKSSSLSPLVKSLAIDFLGQVTIGVVTSKEPVESIQVGEEQVELPRSKVPMLVHFNGEKFQQYSGKLNNKEEMSKWIVEVTGKTPREGPLSKLGKRLYKIRTGKKKAAKKDEL
ncbi:protein disulfide-isomerase Mpd1p [Diutina catenulata]